MNNSMEEDVYYQRTGKVNKLSKNKKASPKKDKFKRGSFDESDYGDDFRRGRK